MPQRLPKTGATGAGHWFHLGVNRISSTVQVITILAETRLRLVWQHHSPTQGARETETGLEYSLQTNWMLAVRDHADKAAFGRLFDYYAPRLKAVICRSGVSAAQAEEIVQDVMLTVWRKAGQYDPSRAQVSAWIYQIARNRQVDVLRRENRPLPEMLLHDVTVPPDASLVVGLEQETAQLKRAMQQLRPEQREMVEKAYFGELSHSDIQAETGLPLGTIKSRIRLGLQRLRQEFKGNKAP